MLSDHTISRWLGCCETSLNTPSGAGCFLTTRIGALPYEEASLNAPSGARCFLTIEGEEFVVQFDKVLMHLLVLGAFRHRASTEEST